MNEVTQCVGGVEPGTTSPTGGTAPPADAGAVDGSTEKIGADPSSSADTSAGDADGASPKKIKFTSRVRRGLALMRMIQMAAQDDDSPTIQTFMGRWKKSWVDDYNAALAWMEQEEDWESVEDAWECRTLTKGGGR